MKRAILCATLVAFTQLLFARTASSFEFGKKIPGDSVMMNRIPAMKDMLSEIIDVMHLSDRFILEPGDVMNLEASVSHHKKYIKYNPEFIDWINQATHDKWATIALIAHEVGHHVKGHTRKRGGSRPEIELEADEYAGLVLQKMGATLKEAQEVMYYIARTVPSKTHPDRQSRMMAIEKGWDEASFSEGGTF